MPQPVPVFLGRVVHGAITLDRPHDFERHLQALDDQCVELVIRKRRTQRSLQQNNYYWGVVITIIAEHLGYTVEEAHEALAWHFLRLGNPDDPLPRRRSTATLTTTEFSEYVETVKRFAAEEWDLYVPDPNEVAA